MLMRTRVCQFAAIAFIAAMGSFWGGGVVASTSMGFVVSDIRFALGPDAKETGACPSGLSLPTHESYAKTEEGRRKANESEAAYSRRLRAGAREILALENGSNLCMNPELGMPDPNFKVVQGSDTIVEGMNLDGRIDNADFRGVTDKEGVDNQFYRVVGCTRGYQSDGVANGFAIEMRTGAWGLLVELEGVDDVTNDDHVVVGIYANADPIYLSAKREPLPHATYAAHRNPLFRATTRGKIVDGKLTTEPVDVYFESVTNSMYAKRILRDAILKATLIGGELQGYLGGYAPVEALYDSVFGFRNGTKGNGELAAFRLRSGSANGKARVLGYSCHGAYHALHQHADAHPNSEGRNTSISMQYEIKAIPAFVVDVDTTSRNELLVTGGGK